LPPIESPQTMLKNHFTSLHLHRIIIIMILFFVTITQAAAQRFLSDYDSSLFIRDTVRPFLKRMENLHFSGYIQPQFQVADSQGAPSYEGGNFAEFSNNRFMLRRARIKIDYFLQAKDKYAPRALFTFQIDATERGVFVRDMFLRLYEPKQQNFSLTMGLFARPFGYELNLSSGYRESPERGRMSQILMPTERDLGAMVSYESRNPGKKNPQFKFDIGAFNGPGLSGTTDFDSYKDIISRLTLKPLPISKNFVISAGLSFLEGGWRQATKYKYEMTEKGGNKFFQVDSNLSNIGGKAPRQYRGADVQLVWKHGWGKTEWRAEYWRGTQSGTAASTTNPGFMPAGPNYIRKFDGAFFYFLQNIVNEKWEFIAKYDWYDPNTKVAGHEIGKAGTNLGAGDIKFSTLGIGLTRYFTENLKLLAYYDVVRNEETGIPGFTGDIKDNIFTFRMQLRF
jgi:hypothetical protein